MTQLLAEHAQRYTKHHKPFLRKSLGVTPRVKFHVDFRKLHKATLKRQNLDQTTRLAIHNAENGLLGMFATSRILPLRQRGKWTYHIHATEGALAEEIAHAAVFDAVLGRERRARVKVEPLLHYKEFRDLHEGVAKVLAVALLKRERRQKYIPDVLEIRDPEIPSTLALIKDYDERFHTRSTPGPEKLANTIYYLAGGDPERIAGMVRELIAQRHYDSRDAFDYLAAKYHKK